MGASKRVHSSGSGRMPSVSRRPTKKRSSVAIGRRRAEPAVISFATYSLADSTF